MRQTRNCDDRGASVVKMDDGDVAGDLSLFDHDDTITQQHQQQLLRTNKGSHAASEVVEIAPLLPSDTPLHPPIYPDKDLVNTTDNDNRTPDYDQHGADSNSDADSDSLDEGSLPSVSVQAIPTTSEMHGGNKHILQNNYTNTNTTVVNLSSTKVVSMRRLLYPSLSLCFKWSCRSMTSAASDLSNCCFPPHTPHHILPIIVYTCHTQALIFQLPLQSLPMYLYLTLSSSDQLLLTLATSPPLPPLPLRVDGHLHIKGDYQPTPLPPYSLLQLSIYTSLLPMYFIHHPVVYALVETKLTHTPVQPLTQIDYNTLRHTHYIHLTTPLQTLPHLLPLVIYTQALN